MPKLPRISGTECVRALERMGFDQRRQRGSHVVMRRGEHGCSVPLHREMKTGVLRQARVSPEEFVRHLK